MVPCGRCAFCLATRKSDWSTRLYYEAKKHIGSKFVTLTYANPHLKWKNCKSQLHKPDLQKWFKIVRKAGYKIRYYAVGEYGARTYRPHYHVILFGHVPDSVIRQSWRFGEVHIGKVSQASIAYCLKYVVNSKASDIRHQREAPFTVMSRRPGIGANYLTKAMIKWHKDGRKNYVMLDGARRHLPRYYKTKIFSKIDLVRIAVRENKEAFKRAVSWLRSPPMQKMRSPIDYRREQRLRAAKKIRDKNKLNLTI